MSLLVLAVAAIVVVALTVSLIRHSSSRGPGGSKGATAPAPTWSQAPLRPLDGPFNLKIHGPLVSLHLIDPSVLAHLPPEPRLAHQRIPSMNLLATYRVGGQPDRCISEDHLRELGIDTRDIHGIGLAVLRQNFDEGRLRRIRGSGAPTDIHSTDGTAGALLLFVADFLRPDEQLTARLFGPDRLSLARASHDWEQDSPEDGVAEPLTYAIDHRGFRIL